MALDAVTSRGKAEGKWRRHRSELRAAAGFAALLVAGGAYGVAPRHRPNAAKHRQHGPQPHSGRNYHGVSRAAPCRWSGTTARPGAVHDRRQRVDLAAPEESAAAPATPTDDEPSAAPGVSVAG